MNRILALWAVPRSTSTAFEWMMRVRGDFACLHEPFGEVWYQGEDPDWPRVTADSVRTPGLTYESAWRRVQELATERSVFIKDFPHYLDPYFLRQPWADEFLGRFTHSFLIRHPAKTLTSMHKNWPTFHEKEAGFPEQRRLFDRLTALAGATPPPVIDSDDLLARPAEMVEAWCAAVAIPFLPEALSWEPGARDEVSWWEGGSFHENLRNSDGLRPQPETTVDLVDAPVWLQDMVERMAPHYEHLRAHRLRVDGAVA